MLWSHNSAEGENITTESFFSVHLAITSSTVARLTSPSRKFLFDQIKGCDIDCIIITIPFSLVCQFRVAYIQLCGSDGEDSNGIDIRVRREFCKVQL